MAKKSKIVDTINTLVISGKLEQQFSVKDIQALGVLTKSPSFLSKHCEYNPGDYTPYFKRMERGIYSLYLPLSLI